ncbi:MAG: hypothetical protein HQ562_10050 [Candidatus Marinimicrobia bacterium]|nr:hypothetical protein [Candidatus Neomarinimicrobiota bacterium]
MKLNWYTFHDRNWYTFKRPLTALTDSSFTKLLGQKRVKLITYDTIIDRIGLSVMISPVSAEYK